MQTNILEGLKLLNIYTAGSLDIWYLSGPHKASCRAHIMSALAGTKMPRAKSGVNAIRSLLFQAANADGDCLAAQEKNFLAWAKNALNNGHKVENGVCVHCDAGDPTSCVPLSEPCPTFQGPAL